ncbi:hypothetical protein [Sorangium sp. So ce128]|uniref:hypothetical protein n=1 Tax=Sorangium sp. So ce128 TaxID=3133281 RepID=UPI003F5F64C4
MAVDASGQIVLAADDSDSRDPGTGTGKLARFELARLDASGNDLWWKSWNAPLHDGSASASQEGLAGIAVDGDGSVFLAGNAHCDFDFGGGPLVGANCYALGNTIVAGSVTGTLDADGTALGAEDGAERQFVVRLDRDGHISWSHILSPEFSRVHGLAVDPEGNVAIVGQDASAANSANRGGNIVTKLDVAAP